MKINNKGYLIVEIIVASVLAMGLAYFLLELVIDFKNKNEDYYVNTLLETDKALMTREVMNDVSNYKIKSITSDNENYVEFVYVKGDDEFTKRITIDKENEIFKYGVYNSGYVVDENYFEKSFANELTVEGITIENKCYYRDKYVICDSLSGEEMKEVIDGMVIITVDATTPYSDYNYGLELNINYKVNGVTIFIQEYNYGVDDKEYNPGDIIEWPIGSNLKWYVLVDSPSTSKIVTLILANNYKDGIYGNSIDYINSNPYNIFLGNGNDSFINVYPEIKKAIEEGTLLLDNLTNTYIRLATKNELSNKIPNDSGTPFWTMSNNEEKIYLGGPDGKILTNIFDEYKAEQSDLYANEYNRYIYQNNYIFGGAGYYVVAKKGEWWKDKGNEYEVANLPTTSIVKYYTSNLYEKRIGCQSVENIVVRGCERVWDGYINVIWYYGYWSDDNSTASSSNLISQYANRTNICWGKDNVDTDDVYYSRTGNECLIESTRFGETLYLTSNPIEYYVPLGTKEEKTIGYRPVINVLKKGR